MAKRKSASRGEGIQPPPAPASFIELFHWAKDWRLAGIEPPQTPKPETVEEMQARQCRTVRRWARQVDLNRSDEDEQPARTFHAEFVAHLKRLGCKRAGMFRLATVIPFFRQVTKPVPTSARRFVRDKQRFAKWKGANGQTYTVLVETSQDGNDVFVETVKDAIRCVRLYDLKIVAQNWCWTLAIDAGEVPSQWDRDHVPDWPLRTVDDLDRWVTAEMGLLDNKLFRGDGIAKTILERVIEGMNVWFDAHNHVADRPAKLVAIRRRTEEELQATILELRKYLAALKPAERPDKPPSGAKLATINARMIDLLGRKPEAKDWSARQFSFALTCSKGSIGTSPAWRTLMQARKDAKADLLARSTFKDRQGKRRSNRDN